MSILRAKAASSLNPQALHTCLAQSTHLISAQRTKPKVNLLPANTAPACRMKPTSWPSTCVIRPCPPQTPSQTPLSPQLIPQVTPTYTPISIFSSLLCLLCALRYFQLSKFDPSSLWFQDFNISKGARVSRSPEQPKAHGPRLSAPLAVPSPCPKCLLPLWPHWPQEVRKAQSESQREKGRGPSHPGGRQTA